MEKNVVFFFLGFFIIVQLFGLYLGNSYLNLMKTGEIDPIFPEPEKPENSFILFLYILSTTGIVILVIKYKKKLLKAIEIVAAFSAILMSIFLLFPTGNLILIFLVVSVLNLWRILRPSPLIQNITIILAIPAIGALLGSNLGILASLLFIVLLSIYDFIAVFITKHMIHIAKEITKSSSVFALSMPYKFKKPVVFKVGKKRIKKKFHMFQLGSGDLAIPLVVSVSTLAAYSLEHALLTVLGSTISFFLLLYFFTKKPQPLPAIPLVSVGTIAGLLAALVML